MSEVVAAVLAGGRSSRFGRDKAGVRVGAMTSLERVVAAAAEVTQRVVVVGGAAPPPAAALDDLEPGGGPVQALLAVFRAWPEHGVLALACDLPRLTAAELRPLLPPPDGASVRFVILAGIPQPLLACYGSGAAAAFEAAFLAGRRALRAVLRELAPMPVEEAALRAAGADPGRCKDFDTPEDLARLG